MHSNRLRDVCLCIPLLCIPLLLAACAHPAPPVEDLRTGQNLAAISFTGVSGQRDGDKLSATARFDRGALVVEMQFAIGPVTKLSLGQWHWRDQSGSVAERSVTFLGGQSAKPSIGGRFDLLDADGIPHYRVTVPLSQLAGR